MSDKKEKICQSVLRWINEKSDSVARCTCVNCKDKKEIKYYGDFYEISKDVELLKDDE